MKVLVIGSGGREHALCWKLRQSPLLAELYCAPGNPGIAAVADRVDVAVDEVHKLADFAADLGIDLTIVGPELPLVLGIVDEFERRGLRIFGPSSDAAVLEGSKVFAKEFMLRHDIPTAPFSVAHDIDEARKAALRIGLPAVLKADGLAAGKGVLIVRDKNQLEEALTTLFEERRFGGSADRVVVEECLEGEEVSLLAVSDGRRLLPLATSKDYKRIGENDVGPNTGGMGAHSPAGVLDGEAAGDIVEKVMWPVISAMAEENRPFSGFLYAGLMLTQDGPKVLEFNVRLGDPEAQVLLPRLESDLLPVLTAGAAGRFGDQRLLFRKEAAACVVLAAPGYPGKPTTGELLEGLETAAGADGVEVFHAGTALDQGRLVSAGGRVLNVCAMGRTLRDALRRCYGAATAIGWPRKVMRRDIGKRVVEMLEGAQEAS